MSKNAMVSPFVPEEVKNTKEWHIKNHQYYLKDGMYDIHKANYNTRARNYLMGDFDPLYEHSFLTISDNGLPYPVDAINFNAILPIIEQMQGMFSSRGYAFDVQALSPTAISRKDQAKRMMEVDHDLLPLALDSEVALGAAFAKKDTAKTPRELDEKKKTYKDMSEIVVQRLLNDFVIRYNLELNRQSLYRDSNVYGDCHMMIEYVDGYLKPTLLRPGEVFYDTTARDPLLTDARFYMVLRYMTVAEVYNQWKLTEEDIEKLKGMGKSTLRLGAFSAENNWPVMTDSPGGGKVMVSTLYWKDIRVREGIGNEDKYGNVHYGLRDKFSKKKGKRPTTSKDIEVEIIRHCTMIGGEICPENGWGEVDWMPRTVDDNWTKVAFPIMSLVPRLIEGKQKSTVDLLTPLQGMRDRCFYMINKAMKKDRGKAVLYDRSQQPEGYDLEDVMYDADLMGVLGIESRQFGSSAGYNQFQNIDLGISPTTQLYVNFAAIVRQEMMSIAGLSEASMGQIQGASQTLGTTQASIGQTNIRHDWYYRLFDLFTRNILQFSASVLKKCATEDPERFANIIGDDGVLFLKNNPDIDLEDIGVSILVDQRAAKDQQVIENMTTFGIQNGFVNYAQGMKVLLARDEKEMLLMLDEIERNMKQERAQQAQAAQAMEQQKQANDASIKMQAQRAADNMRLMEMQSRERMSREKNASMAEIARSRNASELQQSMLTNQARQRGLNRRYSPRS